VGRRFVLGNKVRIEWRVDGKKRTRTIGVNSPDSRREADETLRQILDDLRPAPDLKVNSSRPADDSVVDAVRDVGGALLDLADLVAGRIERTVARILAEAPEDN